MSNILIIKHGSLGDIVQISGVLRDLRENFKDSKIYLLSTLPYVELLSRCPFIDAVLIDKRLFRWNIYYLFKLMKMIKKYNFDIVYDLQNSSRTSFYRKYLFGVKRWSSTETTLEKGRKKKDFDKEPVLERFNHQLEVSKIKTEHSMRPDFSWAITNVNHIVNKYFGKNFVLILPFCSPNLPHKKWPYYNELIKIIKSKHQNLEIVVPPGPNEIEEARKLDAVSILNNNKSLNVMELAGLIKKSSYVIANDTGPAHMAAHLGKTGIVLFGSHTTAKKVSIETDNFKAVTVENLSKLSAENVYLIIKEKLKLIN